MTTLEQVWRTPPGDCRASSDEVHVWRVPLHPADSRVESLRRILSEDERSRAQRYHFPEDRRRFIVARGVLRTLLGGYLSAEPSRLRFRYGRQGKPALAPDSRGDDLRFNLAHSNDLALVAIGSGREVGVDLEFMRPDRAAEGIAEHFFAPGEVAALRALPANLQPEAFFHCWTRKEAYLKATGTGLALPLDRFEVSLVPGERAALLRTEADPLQAARWSLQALFPGPNYVAALAVEGHSWQLRCWQWSA